MPVILEGFAGAIVAFVVGVWLIANNKAKAKAKGKTE